MKNLNTLLTLWVRLKWQIYAVFLCVLFTNGAHQILYQELNIQVRLDIQRFYLKPWKTLFLRKRLEALAIPLSQALRLSHDCNLPTLTEKKTIKIRQKLWQ